MSFIHCSKSASYTLGYTSLVLSFYFSNKSKYFKKSDQHCCNLIITLLVFQLIFFSADLRLVAEKQVNNAGLALDIYFH